MKKRHYIILLIGILISFHSIGQAPKEDIEKNAFSINILGTGTYLGLGIERLFFKHYNLEVAIGLIGIGTGLTYYPSIPKKQSIRPYLGIKYTSHAMVDGPHNKVSYIPVGITYFSNKVSIGLDFGPALTQHVSPGYFHNIDNLTYPYNSFGLFGNFKLSFRF